MPTTDPRIDAYIEKSAEFARPILRHIRQVVHAAAPEIEETLKWGMPSFTHKGIVCGMAAFKQHCTLHFWKGSLVVPGDKVAADQEGGMGQFGRITSPADLPPDDELAAYVREAVRLNEQGVKPEKKAKPAGEKKELPVPDELVAALEQNEAAGAAWAGFSPSKRKDYVEWITEAKSDATRRKRLDTAVEWISQGKGRNWKYER